MCDCKSEEHIAIMDITTPRNGMLSAFYKRSFAYYTLKERMPTIITQTIDILVRNKDQIGKRYGNKGQEELKVAIGELSKLKYEIQTNKHMRDLTSEASDVKFYNVHLAKENNSFFSAVWLHAECYMYRRIREIFELSETLNAHDPFEIQKQESYVKSMEPMYNLSTHLMSLFQTRANSIASATSGESNSSDEADKVKEDFIKLLKINLWGNKCDLSFSNGKIQDTGNPFEILENFESNILCDHSEEIWNAVSDRNQTSDIIDIILDNAGYELFTDLCLADFIITNNLASIIRFYVKSIPWFISDVMTKDFHWMLKQLQACKIESLNAVGERWANYVESGIFILVEHDFFTLPVDYSLTHSVNLDLYEKFQEAKLLIFKGDLNYRKLFGEKMWDSTIPCREGLQGFLPSNLCTLRTIKCDIVCGLKENLVEELSKVDPNWMGTGDYGVIQFVALL